MLMRLADYIFKYFADHGIRQVFLVTGGAAMHLNDAIGRNPKIKYVCCHHEQACAMAAEGFFRASGKMAIVQVTAGPGGINALNGVFGAWTDSIPMLVISGQVKRETLLTTYGLQGKLRQLGDQEVDIVNMVKGITKYAVSVTEPQQIRYHLEKAFLLATQGRPGPVWLDIPVDVQAIPIEVDKLRGYDDSENRVTFDEKEIRGKAQKILDYLTKAKRPIFLGGTGVRLAGAVDLFIRLAEKLQIPVATAWTHDLITSDHPLFCGRQGTIGSRAGNFCVQSSDFILILGSRLCIRQVSYNWPSFARFARTAQIDIDPAELNKPTFRSDFPVHADVKKFLEIMLDCIESGRLTPEKSQGGWLRWCQERREKNPVVLPHQRLAAAGKINPYAFVEILFKISAPGELFVCGDATACISAFQSGFLRKNQRLFSNSGCASMGYDLPAAIGAAFGSPSKRIICLAGDGSLCMNVQELATVAHHQLPIKLFVLENGGYASIRATQDNFFGLRVGAGPESGLSFPDFSLVAQAYGIPAISITPERAAEQIAQILEADGPQVGIVPLDPSQSFEPKTSSRRLPDGTMETAPLEDMAPFMERDEFFSNMVTENWEPTHEE
jgi:acetolactate synthase-1/2/3 large subunit